MDLEADAIMHELYSVILMPKAHLSNFDSINDYMRESREYDKVR